VQTGREALGLIQKHHYDFCFTDLKMPEMDGVEVTKAVKYLRPDIDVIVITGYATIESAVDTMKFGAMDYIQKPFSDDELIDLLRRALLKRQDNIQKQFLPKVEITHIYKLDYTKNIRFSIPGGVFISEGHTWITIEQDGRVKVGMDDFAKKFIGKVHSVEFPNIGMKIKVGQVLFVVKQNNRSINFMAPINGKVSKINNKLVLYPDDLNTTPYENNWICVVETNNLDSDLQNLKIGNSAVAFYYEEIQELHNFLKNISMKQLKLPISYKSTSNALRSIEDRDWQKIVDRFF
ncbi:response regulator, partial [Candidatus Bathyarchaeota archaeon]|nr:response regulator [Candidatus Bathyarchaeota archaeon]